MSIRLSDYEKGKSFDGDFDKELRKLQQRMERIQVAHIVHRRKSIIMFEGWDAAGKGGIIKRMTAPLDPRYYKVWPIGAPTPEEKHRHFLWRFWTRLPTDKEIAVFDRSWYGRVLVERVEGFATKAEWRRGYDEINDFEAQQIEAGNNIIKVFVHITQDVQDGHLAQRLDDPWKRWKTEIDDYRNRNRRGEYLDAMHDMFDRTDTKHAPWTVIDGNDRKSGRIATLTAITDQLEKMVPMTMPDADPAVVKMAKEAFNYRPQED